MLVGHYAYGSYYSAYAKEGIVGGIVKFICFGAHGEGIMVLRILKN
jgi:hypothetical protein